MKQFVCDEEDLSFTFHAELCLKWDDHPRFAKGLAQLSTTKAVDFVLQTTDRRTTLLEAKDFRRYRIENKQRLVHGGDALAAEVARKVLDTAAALLWAAKRERDDEVERATQTLLEAGKLHVLLWIEQDRMDAASADSLAGAIRVKLRPLPARVTVTSMDLEKRRSDPLDWVKVVSRTRRKK